VEVAPGRSGGEQVSRVRLNLVLYVVALLAAAVAVVVGVEVAGDLREDPAPASLPAGGSVRAVALDESDEEEQERLGAVVEAASAEVTAFLNISYQDPQASFDQVLAGATGAFRTQFEKSTADLGETLAKSESVQESEILWTGIVAADGDSATVNVAASGTVTNTFTEGKAEARNYRLQLELVLTDGAWLTRDLQFIG